MVDRVLICAGIAALFAACNAAADQITAGGIEYDNVLVSETSSFYYVQLPTEGRTLSFPKEEVDPSTVYINDDPYFRDELKATYDEMRARREAGEEIVDDPAFHVSAEEMNANTDALLGGDGGGGSGGGGVPSGGLGRATRDVEAQLGGFGLQFADGPPFGGHPTRVANQGTGITFELIGPPNQLMGMRVKGSGPSTTYMQVMSQAPLLISQLVPAASPKLPQLRQEAESSGQATANAGGVSLRLTHSESGGNVDFELSVMAGG